MYAKILSRITVNEGWTDPIVARPEHRRREAGRALLLSGLRLLVERGVERAALGNSSENLAMQRLATRVGFRLESAKVWFSKQVEWDADSQV
jgi:ribosomal protein S18 acetylase RimI-like enzyme